MPLVRQRVKEFFGREPSKKVHPDEAVALGAAIYANSVLADKSDVTLLDVTPQALGILVTGGFVRTMIEKNTPVPFNRRENFTTVKDNQPQIKIVVLQGSSRIAAENEVLGEFILDGLRPVPRGQAVIAVDFSIDVDGIVHVSALDEASGKKKEIMVTARSGLDEEEKRKVLEKNIDHLLETKECDDAARLENDVSCIVAILEMKLKLIEEIPDGISDPNRELIMFSDELISQAKDAVATKDHETMNKIISNLNRLEILVESLTSGKN